MPFCLRPPIFIGAGRPLEVKCLQSPRRTVLPVWAGRWWGWRCRCLLGRVPAPYNRNHIWENSEKEKEEEGFHKIREEHRHCSCRGLSILLWQRTGTVCLHVRDEMRPYRTCSLHCSSFGRQRSPDPPQSTPSPSQTQRCTVCGAQATKLLDYLLTWRRSRRAAGSYLDPRSSMSSGPGRSRFIW